MRRWMVVGVLGLGLAGCAVRTTDNPDEVVVQQADMIRDAEGRRVNVMTWTRPGFLVPADAFAPLRARREAARRRAASLCGGEVVSLDEFAQNLGTTQSAFRCVTPGREG